MTKKVDRTGWLMWANRKDDHDYILQGYWKPMFLEDRTGFFSVDWNENEGFWTHGDFILCLQEDQGCTLAWNLRHRMLIVIYNDELSAFIREL